jgi:hypothetical protein
VQLNSESLATIFSAIDKLKGLSDGLSQGFGYTCHQANENKESKEEILGKTIDITNPTINQI